jgi:hypothetical protein
MEMSFNDFLTKFSGDEGLVFLGCGGNIQDWIDGIQDIMKEENIIVNTDCFIDTFTLKTTGGRVDLVMVFSPHGRIDIGRLAIWRIQFGDCSWISDYVTNYADQHGYIGE